MSSIHRSSLGHNCLVKDQERNKDKGTNKYKDECKKALTQDNGVRIDTLTKMLYRTCELRLLSTIYIPEVVACLKDTNTYTFTNTPRNTPFISFQYTDNK